MPKKKPATRYIPDMPRVKRVIQDLLADLHKIFIGAIIAFLFTAVGVLVTDHFSTVSHASDIKQLKDTSVTREELKAAITTQTLIDEQQSEKLDLLLVHFKLVPIE